MTDRTGATTAHLNVSLLAKDAPAPTQRRRPSAARTFWTNVRAGLQRLGPFAMAALDRDAAIQARLEGFDDPQVRRIVARRPYPEDVRQEFLLRQYGGPRRW
jgi:hypothetical protein